MNKRLTIILGLAIILLASGLYFLYLNSTEEREVDDGYSLEAMLDSTLALKKLFNSLDVKYDVIADEKHLYSFLYSKNKKQTLILLNSINPQTDDDDFEDDLIEELTDWVEAGGHLIFSSCNNKELSQALNVECQRQKDDKADDHLTRLYLVNEQSPAYLDFYPDRHLIDKNNKAFAWANSASNTHMLQLMRNKGMVTALSDIHIWFNFSIDRYDHAWLAWYLTQDRPVMLLSFHENEASPSLLMLTLQNYPITSFFIVLISALALWRLGSRLGPLLADPQPPRRQLTEHLIASSNFQLRYFDQAHNIRSLQSDILRLARVRYAGFENLTPAQRWHALAKLSHIPEATISQLMRPPLSNNMANYISLVNQLQTLRNAL